MKESDVMQYMCEDHEEVFYKKNIRREGERPVSRSQVESVDEGILEDSVQRLEISWSQKIKQDLN